VLADAYVRREYYPHTPRAVLDPERRRRAVADRLFTYADVDVLCLQEVDAALFALAGTTLPDSIGRLLPKRGRGEGCAIFVRRALAGDAIWREHVFSDHSGHVAIGVTFEGVAVVSTHLKWEPPDTPANAHRGLGQLAEILELWSSGSRIICGDFNADADSDVAALGASRGLSDAYASLADACTCNANGKKRRIDYILHSPDFTAAPTPLLAIQDDTPLPSVTEPSDHLAIEARMDR